MRSCRRATVLTISREGGGQALPARGVRPRRDAAALERPLIGLVSRLTDQKGFDLIAAAAEELMTLDAAWVMLGAAIGAMRSRTVLAARFPDRVSATIGYDERLEHLISGAPTRS